MKTFYTILTLIVLGIAGWITNLIYIFTELDGGFTTEWIISVVGAFLAPIGAIHGIVLWF